MLRCKLLRGASGVSALALASSLALAQETLPTIEVGAAAGAPDQFLGGGGAQQGSLTVPPVDVQRRQVFETAGSVDFVNANTPEIQTRHVADLTDALKDVPGVFAETRYGQEIRLSVRGSNITRDFHLRGIELLQDGVPMNYPDGGSDFYEIDPRYFRSIEVFKGGNALAFGSTTLGGAINFVSPTAYTAISPNLFAIDGGSYGSVRGQAQVSRVIGDFDFLINTSFPKADGFREHSKSDYTLLNGNFGYRFSQSAETRFYVGVYDTRQQLPGTLTLGDALINPRLATLPSIPGVGFDGFSADQQRNVTNQRISNKTTFETDVGRLDLSTWFVHNKLYHPIFLVLDQDGYTWGFTPRFTSRFDVGGHRNDLIAGGRVWGGRSTDKWFVNYNGQELNPPFGDPRVRDNRMEAINLEAYFENRFFIVPEIALMFGAKIFSDSRKYSVLGGIPTDPTPSHGEESYRGINPKFGFLAEPAPNIQVFADITGSRDVPDFIDLTQNFFPGNPNPQFVPLLTQKAWTGEIGTRGSWDRFNWNITYYRSQINDELLKFNTNPGLGIPATTFNAKHTVHQGVEFGASAELLRDISGPGAGDFVKLSQIWTWNDFRFEDDAIYGNKTLPGVPRHLLRTTLSYTRPDGLYFAPAIDWVPEGAYVDYARTLQTPGYVLFGVQGGVTLFNNISFYIDARNLSNRHYVSDVTTIIDARGQNPQAFYPGVGRTVYGGMRVTF